MSTEDTKNSFELVIDEPSPFFSKLDEALFFNGLKGLASVKDLYVAERRTSLDTPNRLALVLHSRYLSEDDLNDLLGLLTRYGLPLRPLASQCNSRNEHWFKRPNTYWYNEVFGDCTDF